jgi:lipoate-protein ligase A
MFKVCEYLDEEHPHGAALNMAIDEVLLGYCRWPMLRVYGWERPAVSFGYFQRFEALASELLDSDLDRVRRWTGGGVVSHGEDWTYSLIVPRVFMEEAGRPPEAYEKIHGGMAVVLRDCGIDAEALGADAGAGGMDCFRNAVKSDVVVGGEKVAGAGQRRTRAGLLHQGSVQGVVLPENFGVRLGGYLAEEVRVVGSLSAEVLAAAEGLAAEKYGTKGWLRKF